LLALLCAGCAPGMITPGGQYSGMPDTTMGNHFGNLSSGSISTSGVINTRRDGPLIGR
jgi:hypothetical protein